jgi:hypothetical protein
MTSETGLKRMIWLKISNILAIISRAEETLSKGYGGALVNNQKTRRLAKKLGVMTLTLRSKASGEISAAAISLARYSERRGVMRRQREAISVHRGETL